MNIFFLSGLVAEYAGASAPFVIALGGVICGLLGLTIREFSKHISTSGSFYSFVTLGLGQGKHFQLICDHLPILEMGFLTIWTMIFGYGLLNVNCLLQFSAWTADVITRNTHLEVPWWSLSIGLTVVIAILAWRGINQSLTLCLVLACMEAVILIIFILFIIIKVNLLCI